MQKVSHAGRRFFTRSWVSTWYLLLKKINWLAIIITVAITWLLLWAATSQDSDKVWGGLAQSTWAAVTGSVFAAALFLLIRTFLNAVEKTETTFTKKYYQDLAELQGVRSVFDQRGSTEAVLLYKELISKAENRIWAFGMLNRNFIDQHQKKLAWLLQNKHIDILIGFWEPEAKLSYYDSSDEDNQTTTGIIEAHSILKGDPHPRTDWASAIEVRENGFLTAIDDLPFVTGQLRIVHVTIPTNISCLIIDDEVFFFPFMAGPDNNTDPMIRCAADVGIGKCIVAYFEKLLESNPATRIVASRVPRRRSKK